MGIAYRFHVPDLRPCCGQALKDNISLLRVLSVDVDVLKQDIVVQLIEDDARTKREIIDVIKARGYRVVQEKNSVFSHALRAFIGLAIGLGVFLVCFFSAGLPFVAMALIGSVSFLLTLTLGYPSFRRAFLALRHHRTLTMDSLFAVSTLIVLSVSMASLFFPLLPMMFEVGLFIFGFRHLGQAIEVFLTKKMTQEASFKHLIPEQLDVWTEGKWQKKALSLIRVGERIRLQPGALLPLNARADCGERTHAYVITEIEDGEKEPQLIQENKSFLAGIRLDKESAPLELVVEESFENSYLNKLSDSLEKALQDKQGTEAPTKIMVRRILSYFIPIVFLAAILSAILVSVFASPILAISCFIGVLVSACPCVLGLVVPLSLLVGVGKAQRYGLSVMNGLSMEQAHAIDTVVCDLNGTLTQGRLDVEEIIWEDSWQLSADAYLKKIYQIELLVEAGKVPGASPSFARALLRYFRSKDLTVSEAPSSISDIQMHPEGGIFWKDGEETWSLRNENLLGRSINDDKIERQRLFLLKNERLIATIIMQDKLREEAAETIAVLQKQVGVEQVFLVTGASESTAKKYGKALGFQDKNIRFNQRPLDKEQFIKSLKEDKRRVMSVGDGSNDILMTAGADLGVVVLSRSDELTSACAGVHVRGNSLKPLQFLLPISKQTYGLVRFNLVASLSYNLTTVLLAGGVLLAAGVVLSPVVGAVLMMLQVVFLFFATYAIHKKNIDLPTNDASIARDFYPEKDRTLAVSHGVGPALAPVVFQQPFSVNSNVLGETVWEKAGERLGKEGP